VSRGRYTLLTITRRGCPRRVQALAMRTLRKLERVSELRHHMTVLIVKEPAVATGPPPHGAGTGFACFDPHRVTMTVCAGMVRLLMTEHSYSRRDADAAFVETLCHEWAHYEQFRNAKRLQERGIGVRARALMAAIDARPRR
jgi:hypothetical protein